MTEELFKNRIKLLVETVGNASILAKATGISPRSIGLYMSGVSDPSRERLIAMAEAAEFNLLWLATGEGPMHRGDRQTHKQPPCEDHRCVGDLHTRGHILSKTPAFDAEILSHIFSKLQEFKEVTTDEITKKQEMDVISLAAAFLQPENKIEAMLICSIVKSWKGTQ